MWFWIKALIEPHMKKKKRIAFTITSWSPWQPWLSLHERLTECDLQWSFLWGRSWRLGIPANTMAGFSINMIICCRLPGRWTSTASGERLELYTRQQRGWMTTEYRRCTWPQMYTHHHIGEWRYLILIQKNDAGNVLAAVWTLFVHPFIVPNVKDQWLLSVTTYAEASKCDLFTLKFECLNEAGHRKRGWAPRE